MMPTAPDKRCRRLLRSGAAEFPFAMAKHKKAKKKALKKKRHENGVGHEHVLDRLYVVIEGRKGADPDTSYTPRLFSRGRQQIAQQLGEEAAEARIKGVRGDKAKLSGEE